MTKTDLFDYFLPGELIAQVPSRKRDQSRMMVLNRETGLTDIKPFKSIVDYLNKGDGLVVNSTRVFKARLLGHRSSGAKVELFLVRKVSENQELWETLARPSKKLRESEEIEFPPFRVRMLSYIGRGRWRIEFKSTNQRLRTIARYGHVPLPHYIKRNDSPSDIRRYQTMFADRSKVGAVAAPTAGFHFTRPVVEKIESKGVRLIEVTLHVGPGTFKPVTVDDIDDHSVDAECAELSPMAARSINSVRSGGGKIIAVGTTSVRTLESAKTVNGNIQPFAGEVDLYIKPGFEFKQVDHLLTNFHLPKSSLVILTSAFGGRERIMNAYQRAIAERMRFYSYGDCMLIL